MVQVWQLALPVHPDQQLLAAQFTAEEQVQLTLLLVAINGWNRLAVGFRSLHPVATGAAG